MCELHAACSSNAAGSRSKQTVPLPEGFTAFAASLATLFLLHPTNQKL